MKNQATDKSVYNFIKRCLDIFGSFFAIILFTPVFLILAIIIKCTSKGPIFYTHKRVGKNGKEIGILKFRSMVVDADKMFDDFTDEQKKEFNKNFKLKNDPRVTKAGKILRRSSLDELPQLFNILIGDISIVGPRPITYQETLLYKENRDLFLSVKPGLTGLWATSGRNNLSYDKRIDLELQYIRERSLWLDIKIIFKTVLSVFRCEGAK